MPLIFASVHRRDFVTQMTKKWILGGSFRLIHFAKRTVHVDEHFPLTRGKVGIAHDGFHDIAFFRVLGIKNACLCVQRFRRSVALSLGL